MSSWHIYVLTISSLFLIVGWGLAVHRAREKETYPAQLATFAFVLAFTASTLLGFNSDTIKNQVLPSGVLTWVEGQGAYITLLLVFIALIVGVFFTFSKTKSDDKHQNHLKERIDAQIVALDKAVQLQANAESFLEKIERSAKVAESILTESPPAHFANYFAAHYMDAYKLYRKTIDSVEKCESSSNQTEVNDELVNQIAETIRAIQKKLLVLLKVWDENPGCIYSASLMIYVNRNYLQSQQSLNPSVIGLHFYDRDAWPSGTDGVLILLEELTTSITSEADTGVDSGSGSETELDERSFQFSLPVRSITRTRKEAEANIGLLPNLPGAPTALSEGFEWIPSTQALIDKAASCGTTVQKEMLEYFENERTHHIGSFISIGVPRVQAETPTAVLNLVSNSTDILDSERKAKAFNFLSTPYLLLLGELAWHFGRQTQK